MSHTAFFYGTLMAPPVLHRVIWGQTTPPTPAHASLLHIRPAILHAYQRHKVRHADYPAILPTAPDQQPTLSVRGTLVTGLTDGDLWRLDIFEGSEYARQQVRVNPLASSTTSSASTSSTPDVLRATDAQEEEQGAVDAETYVWIAGAERLEREEWDFSEFVRDKMQRWVGREGADMDEGFQDVDDAVARARMEDPTGGRGAGGRITRELEGAV